MPVSNDAPPAYDSFGHLISPFYGYLPTKSVCYIFVVLFGISTVLQLTQTIRYRAWWLLPTAVLAGSGEVLGWVGRLWSSYNPLISTPYLIQIVCTIIAPTPLIGAIFITFGRLSARVGEQYSRLSARLYSRIFLTVDIICLLVQSIGGGLAATVTDEKTGELGSNIMLAGIVLQLVSLTIFCILMAEYFVRFAREKPRNPLPASSSSETVVSNQYFRQPMDKYMKRLAVAVCLEALLLYIRAVYRTIELADGFKGHIIKTQVYFNVLDGTMVVLAMIALNIFHPGLLLKAFDSERRSSSIELTFKDTKSVPPSP